MKEGLLRGGAGGEKNERVAGRNTKKEKETTDGREKKGKNRQNETPALTVLYCNHRHLETSKTTGNAKRLDRGCLTPSCLSRQSLKHPADGTLHIEQKVEIGATWRWSHNRKDKSPTRQRHWSSVVEGRFKAGRLSQGPVSFRRGGMRTRGRHAATGHETRARCRLICSAVLEP